MILKKPYAFLIKYFRLIHLILFGSVLFIVIKVNPIVKIFKEIVLSGNVPNIPGNFGLVYLMIIVTIIFSFSMLWLMRNKNKPRNFYTYSLVYYLVFIILLIISINKIKVLSETQVIDLTTAKAYYDIARLVYYPQYFILIFSLVRTVGFDIKKFNFEKDIKELELSKEDSEEFEFVVGIDFNNYLVKLRKTARELRYYFLENTAIIVSIIVISLLASAVMIFYRIEVKEKVYKETQTFSVGSFQYSIIDSYVTNVDKSGKEIIKDKYYLVVNLNITNLSANPKKLNYDDYTISSNAGSLVVDKSISDQFIDIGTKYDGEELLSKKSYYRLFAFKINNYSITNTYQFNILNGFEFSKKTGQNEGIYIKTKLEPKIVTNLQEVSNKYFGTTTKLDRSTLKNSSINITDYKLLDNYVYKYEYCYSEDNCRLIDGIISADLKKGNYTLLILDYDLKLDSNIIYKDNINKELDFFKNFASIKYIVNNQEYTSKLVVKNPNNYNEKAVFEVSSALKSATKIELVLTIRNQKYVINFK